MEVTKRLKGERAHFKARLTHLERLIEQGKLNISEIRSRHDALREQLKVYEKSSVNGLNNSADENEFTDFDELAYRYYAIGTKINEIAGTSIPTPSPTPSRATIETRRSIALPHVDLVHFDGDLESWPAYKENFVSLIDERTDISEIEKFSYLRGSLRGSARKALDSYRPTAANYKIAWNALLETYDRPRLLIEHSIDAILNMEILRDNDRAGLEGLMHDARARVNHLTSLGLTPLAVLTNLYARLTPRQHQAECCSRVGSDAYPSIEDPYKFWTDKLVELPSTTKSSDRKDRKRDQPHAISDRYPRKRQRHDFRTSQLSQEKPERAAAFINGIKGNCLGCDRAGHQLDRCPRFRELSHEARWNLVNRRKICQICLRRHTEICWEEPCILCNELHHAALHPNERGIATTTNAQETGRGAKEEVAATNTQPL
ncbi:hypothetical protein M0802_014753 [Mischocyttarus mexicanus]|nr:hypothetical protein M0802_014753 [Mischocyttarus mexicanus]